MRFWVQARTEIGSGGKQFTLCKPENQSICLQNQWEITKNITKEAENYELMPYFDFYTSSRSILEAKNQVKNPKFLASKPIKFVQFAVKVIEMISINS